LELGLPLVHFKAELSLLHIVILELGAFSSVLASN
jgi:hypothetical protein